MSRQSDAKSRQQYEPKPQPPICSRCHYYSSEMVPSEWNPEYVDERNKRCSLGGFAVKKTASCAEFVPA